MYKHRIIAFVLEFDPVPKKQNPKRSFGVTCWPTWIISGCRTASADPPLLKNKGMNFSELFFQVDLAKNKAVFLFILFMPT